MDSNVDYITKHLTENDRKLMQQKGITMQDLYIGAWLGGPQGVLNYLRRGRDSKDANGTSISNYIGIVKNRGGLPASISSSPYETTA